MIPDQRIGKLAAARSIFACGSGLAPALKNYLLPRLLPNNKISLGEILTFKDKEFVKLVETGFGLPEIPCLMTKPFKSFQTFQLLRKIGKVYKSNINQKMTDLVLLSSLESICTYLNHHSKSRLIFEDEKAHSISIKILSTGTQFLTHYEGGQGWVVKQTEPDFRATANLSFIDEAVTYSACMGRVDTWKEVTVGHIRLAGLIPLLDKFGYVSRIAQKEVPRPR